MADDPSLLLSLLPTYALRLAVAALCGIVLGAERERKDKAAGLRTVVLITMGAALFMIVSDLIPLATEGPDDITRVDPSRVAAQVVTGIGFLGGGAIIQSRGAVHGLTTAAVIWVAAGIGLCVGVGFFMLGGAATVLVLVILVLLNPVRRWLERFGDEHTLKVVVPNNELTLRRVEAALRQHDGSGTPITLEEHGGDTLTLELTYRTSGSSTQHLVEALAHIEGVRGAPRNADGQEADSEGSQQTPPHE